ncbi:hypothetical protein BYT27DRAFT_7253391 [Phlegmacium glaucopus]|nr:hypothetical protein BYT27DRAFT_7253391 [Phlegmacium glaucopus]
MSIQMFPPEILDLFLNELGSAADDMQSRAALLARTPSKQTILLSSELIYLFIPHDLHSKSTRHKASTLLRMSICCLQTATSPTGIRMDWSASTQVMLTAVPLSIGSLFSNLSYLTVLHFEMVTNFPLSLFSSCRHLESLTFIRVVFAKIQPERLSGSLFPLLKRLSISGPWSNDDEAVGIIMTHAAPTLTTLILCDPSHGDNGKLCNSPGSYT